MLRVWMSRRTKSCRAMSRLPGVRVCPHEQVKCLKLLTRDAGFAPNVYLTEPEVAQAVWGKYVPEALANGSLICKPDPMVVGKGLEHIQAAMNRHKQGVSGQKVVVAL